MTKIFIGCFLVCLAGLCCDQANEPAINSGGRDSLVVELAIVDSVTPLEAVDATHLVEYRNSLMGAFVTSIDSVDNSSTAYWIYSVNVTMPKVACDKMLLRPGDHLKWHFRRVVAEPSDTISND